MDADGPGSVLLLTSDVDLPYERPPLSKEMLRGTAAPEGEPLGGEPLPPQVELRLGTTVTRMDLAARTLWAGTEPVRFERLVLALGAHPAPLSPADDDAEVHVLRSLADARRLTTAAGHARTAVVVGSGFIGCEAAAALGRRGVAVTLVTPEEAPQERRLGAEAGARIAEMLTGAGVELRTGVQVIGVQAPRTVHLDDGTTLAPDLVPAAVGAAPEAGWLADSGLNVHEGRIVTDEHLSAAPGVWAAGDAARAHHRVAGRPLAVEHWGDALAMGEAAGHNAAVTEVRAAQDAGESSVHAHATEADPERLRAWEEVPGFWSTIDGHTLKQVAWGDGFASTHLVERTGGWTVWYADEADRVVGVLTYGADDDEERGRGLVARGAALAEAVDGAR